MAKEVPPRYRVWIVLIKTLHSLVYLLMSACIIYLYYAAITATFNWRVWAVVALIIAEGIALLLNGKRCPLTTLAQRLGDDTGDDLIADYLLPDKAVRLTVPICSLIFIVGLFSVLISYLLHR